MCQTNKTDHVRLITLTEEDERLLLTQLQEMETQYDFKCRNCMMKEATFLALYNSS